MKKLAKEENEVVRLENQIQGTYQQFQQDLDAFQNQDRVELTEAIRDSDVFVELENQQRQGEEMVQHLNATIEVLKSKGDDCYQFGPRRYQIDNKSLEQIEKASVASPPQGRTLMSLEKGTPGFLAALQKTKTANELERARSGPTDKVQNVDTRHESQKGKVAKATADDKQVSA